MPINAHPDFIFAEREYNEAQTPEEQIKALEKMISLAPSHKGAENLRAQLKTRLRKFKEKLVKSKKSGRRGSNSSQAIIRKDDMQAVIIGFDNSGKSALLSTLSNIKTTESETSFSTNHPLIRMMPVESVSIQLIENPAINSGSYSRGLTNTADTILILINNLEDLKKIEEKIAKAPGKRIIIFNKIDKLSETEKRKINARMNSRRGEDQFVLISTKTKENIEELKNKIFKSFDKIRVYTKEPGKEKTKRPIIMNPNATIKDIAEKILKGFSARVKETKIWGPSSKFSGQKVGLNHKLKDLDVVEFRTK